MIKIFALFIFLNILESAPLFAVNAPSQKPTPVKLSFIEALDPKDTTSSKRFQDEYELAIKLGIENSSTRLKACGYQFEASQYFYGASDPIQAKEQAESSVKNGTWLIVGPRRSNHYLLLAAGAPETPTVSLMASSDDVANLGPLHLSMSPLNSEMAAVLATELNRRFPKSKQTRYVSIVSYDCLTCKDFANQFDSVAKTAGLKKSGEYLVVGNEPDLSEIIKTLKTDAPEIILLPNYSILTGHIIANLLPVTPSSLFAGGDGWGNSDFGFVQNGPDLSRALGVTIRGMPPFQAGLDISAIKFDESTKFIAAKLGSSSALSLLKIISGMTDLLCSERPDSKSAFAESFKRNGKR